MATAVLKDTFKEDGSRGISSSEAGHVLDSVGQRDRVINVLDGNKGRQNCLNDIRLLRGI